MNPLENIGGALDNARHAVMGFFIGEHKMIDSESVSIQAHHDARNKIIDAELDLAKMADNEKDRNRHMKAAKRQADKMKEENDSQRDSHEKKQQSEENVILNALATVVVVAGAVLPVIGRVAKELTKKE